MLLKELQIRGFKSFLNNTIIKFPPGVTAIVGPNGSGKSNISDAIRWVLGESSVKSLRGAKMEDIIFKGTDNIKPVSFAEVSITFSDCKIDDIPYDEVVVTRRLFRDGTSEYLINKNKVRLRDIRELFMDTGIGRDGYSLIGQGQIDNVLSNRPEDRRDIFEEASGISLYKYKKEEALRKIERSNDDLDRLCDIFDEINRQYTYLEAESIKTEKYNNVILEKNTLKLDLLYYGIKKNLEDFENISKDKELIQSDLNSTKAEIEKLESNKGDMNKEIEDLDLKIQALNDVKMSKLREFSEIKSSHNINIERKKHFQDSIQELNNSIESAYKNIDTISNENLSLKDSLDNWQTEDSNSFDSEINNKRSRLKEVESELNTIREEDHKNELLKLESQANTQIRDEKIKLYEGEFEKLLNELNELNTKIQDYTADLKEKNKQNTSLIDEVNNLNGKLADCNDLLRSKTLEYEDISINISHLSNQNNNAKLNLDFNKNILDTNELFYQPIKFLEKNYNENDGYLGTLVSRINTDSSYVKAIETALGSRLQYVFAKSVRDAKAMIAELNAKKAGRATFLPLDTTNTSKTQVMPNKSDGVLGYAIEFVEAEEPYKSIISYLLKDIVIVDNIDTGIKYQKKYKMIVTQNGEQFNQYGAITGGTSYREKQTPLSIKAKINQLEEDIKKYSEELIILEKSRADYQGQIEALKENIESTNNLLLDKKSQTRILEDTIAQRENEIDAMKNLLEEKQISKDRIKSDLEDLSNVDSTVEFKEIDTLKLNQLEEEQKILINSIDDLESKRQDSVDKILERSNIKYKIESNENKLEEIKNEIRLKKERLLEREKELNELKGLADKSLKELSRIEELQKHDDDEILLIQNKKQEVKNKILDLDRLLKIKQEDTIKLENKLNQQDLKEVRLDESIENFKADISNRGYVYQEFINEARDTKNLREKRDTIAKIDKIIEDLGMVNLNAINEFKELSERKVFYEKQIFDIEKTISDLNSIIAGINQDMKVQFKDNMEKIRFNFQKVFKKLFNGGEADLYLVDESDPLNSGITIVAKPPGKKLQALSLLSGGEKTLTAMALLFAILELKPAPFCILDEIDAALDDINISRYTKFLNELARDSQFLIITHRKTTLEVADTIYGVCMRDKGVSEIISVRVEDYIEEAI